MAKAKTKWVQCVHNRPVSDGTDMIEPDGIVELGASLANKLIAAKLFVLYDHKSELEPDILSELHGDDADGWEPDSND